MSIVGLNSSSIVLSLTVVVLLASIRCSNAQATTQPCVFENGDYYSYDEVTQCFHSIRLDNTFKLQTIDTMRKALQLYTFLDIANHSPDPHLPVKVDMLAGLDAIEQRPYVYDIDFQSDMRDLFDQLYDAHTQYYLPTCYQNVQIRQPFAPVGWGDSENDFKITISPFFDEDLLEYYDSIGINITDYVGMEILEVDGYDAFDYFLKYANNSVGMAKDLGTRFNFVLTVPEPRNDIQLIQYGYWQQRTHRNPFPKQPLVYYKLKSESGEIIEAGFPWSFKSLKSYDGVDSFMEDFYAVVDETDQKAIEDAARADLAEQMKLGGPSKAIRQHSFMRIPHGGRAEAAVKSHKKRLLERHLPQQYGLSVTDDDNFELLVNTTHLTFWALKDNLTMVMFLDDFAPGLSGYYEGLKKGFDVAAERGLTRLIIDLTNNGGGNICVGRTLLAFLQQDGWAGQGQNWGPEDLSLSPLADTLIETAAATGVTDTLWSPAYYDNMSQDHIANNDTSYLLPGVPHIRGGRLRNYTRLVHLDGCGDFGYRIDPAINFSPENVMIVTHGFCGSTCALFANHLALYDNIKTVAVGGIPQQPEMQYTAFPGGQVLENNSLMPMLVELGQNVSIAAPGTADDPVPRRLPTQATYRFCAREIYPSSDASPPRPPQQTNPMEYTFQQATTHMYNDELTAFYPMYVWYEVLPLFEN